MLESNINLRLKQVRVSSRLSQIEFANKLEITQSYLSDLESGKKQVPTKVVHKVAKIFKINADWLLFGNDSPEKLSSEIVESVPKGENVNNNFTFNYKTSLGRTRTYSGYIEEELFTKALNCLIELENTRNKDISEKS